MQACVHGSTYCVHPPHKQLEAPTVCTEALEEYGYDQNVLFSKYLSPPVDEYPIMHRRIPAAVQNRTTAKREKKAAQGIDTATVGINKTQRCLKKIYAGWLNAVEAAIREGVCVVDG